MDVSITYSKKHLKQILIRQWLSACRISLCLLLIYLLFNVIYFICMDELWSLGFFDYIIYLYLVGRIVSKFIISYLNIKNIYNAEIICHFDTDKLIMEIVSNNTKVSKTIFYNNIHVIKNSAGIMLKGKKLNLLIPDYTLTSDQKTKIIDLINILE